MRPRVVAALAAGVLLALQLPNAPVLRAAEPNAGQAAAMVPVPATIIAKNVPPVPRDHVGDLLPYENIRTASFTDWSATGRRILIRTRFAQSMQLHEVAAPMGFRRQLTFFNDPVINGRTRPGNPDQIVFSLNEGGAENYQMFLLDRKAGTTRRFTDGKSRYENPSWSHDGKLLAYTSNARNGVDTDLYVADPGVAGSERKVADVKGSWTVLEWSPDDHSVLLLEEISANETYLHWIDVATGTIHDLTPRAKAGETTVAWQTARWARDGRGLFATSDKDSEFLRLVHVDLAGGKTTVLSAGTPWDVEAIDLSDDGTRLAFFTNEDGYSRLHIIDPSDLSHGKPFPSPDLPAGVASGLKFRHGSHEIAFSVSWAQSPADVYSYDIDAGRLERWTESEIGGLNPEQLTAPKLVRFPTFDEVTPGTKRTIPAFVYLPPAGRFKGPRPVYINVHGGPEGQIRPDFGGSYNYFINELGVVLIDPNVRGSSGYGKTYLKLDNWEKREDSVKDIGALLDWIATQPDLDASRVMVAGGSYGGYMVLATLVHYSPRLRCAFDTVGISNFVTFLENTSEYRRDLRRVEYGDERDPKMRAYLESIAPANHVDKMTRPLLVVQGANDPRVPLAQSDQIVAKVQANGTPVWYLVGTNEGHGFQKKDNSDFQRAVLIEFMRQYLLDQPAVAAR
jgi:dipeptidyl aminopeptidase/acylaminoacyl peptidase